MCVCVCPKSLQSCLTLCDPMDCSQPDSSVHGILQARILEWVATPSSRGIFPNRGSNLHLLHLLHWQAGSLPSAPPGKPGEHYGGSLKKKTRTELPYDLAFPLLGINLVKSLTGKDNTHPNVHGSTTYNSQDTATT